MHLITWPLALPSMIAYNFFNSEGIFSFSTKLLCLIPGKLGQYLRASFYCQTLQKCHYDLAVGFGSFFAHPTAEVGRRVVIGSYSIIGTASIESDVLVSSRVSILSGKYQHTIDSLGEGTATHDASFERVFIGAKSWLGEGSIVMANIDENCIVSSGSVVTKDMPASNIAIGNPARFVKRNYGIK